LLTRSKNFTHAQANERSLQEISPYWFSAASERALTMMGGYKITILTGLRAMKKGNFAVGQRVRLKWELDPPVNIPAGAIGQVTRVSPWDVWVRFEKRVVKLPFSEVEQEGSARDRQRRVS
jgi:hypothetical protein